MQYQFADLVDLDKLRILMEGFSSVTGITTAILDVSGKVLIASGWKDICTKFHRIHPVACLRCRESDTVLAGYSGCGQKYSVYQCKNGLVDAAAPIIVEKKHIGNAFIGQFLFEPPNVEFFRKQAAEFGFDEETYLAALAEVPVFSKEQIKGSMDFLASLAELIGTMGLAKKKARQANAELRDKEELLRAIFNAKADGILVVDKTGSVSQANRQFAEMWKIPRHLLETGQNDQALFEYVRDQLLDPEGFAATVKELDNSSKENLDEVPFKDGRTFERFSCPLIRDGDEVGRLWDFRDITPRKQAEKEREELIDRLETQNAELERFAYTVSHDLKAPLVTMKGFLGALREDLDRQEDGAVQDDLFRIERAADKMMLLLKDLLELSRIGRLVNPPQDIPLTELAREAVELVSGHIAARGVQVDIPPRLPVVFGDRPRLLEVLQNLIDNAVKYMGSQEKPRIEIGAQRQNGQWVYHVRDNGIGIEPRYQERVFGLFEQLNPRVEGSGVGLALVKRIVEIHGGQIWLESDGPDCGSTFFFTLADMHDT